MHIERFSKLLSILTSIRQLGTMTTTKAKLLYVLSPAKTLDMSLSALSVSSQPALLSEATVLVRLTLDYVSSSP